ncbi:hypothetical protein [Maricaulis sp.]|uniref:hypothetical protein n=1 Tax=Maricaulis sp. TaxID=1486257 RepID=UPI0026271540|nr:hypothetical protein [Maricaulis sp.]
MSTSPGSIVTNGSKVGRVCREEAQLIEVCVWLNPTAQPSERQVVTEMWQKSEASPHAGPAPACP